MNRKTYWLAALLTGVILSGSVVWSIADENQKCEEEQEKAITLEVLPTPVRTTIEKEAGQNKIKEIEQVISNGKTFYEAEWVKGDKEVEIKVSPDGKLLGKEVEDNEDDEKDKARKPSGESERQVTEAEVPAAALATLKKVAAGAEITEFTEEIEHGGKFYEGSWKGPSGNKVEVSVTTDGTLVEIEEKVRVEEIPKAVLAAAQKVAGKDAKLGLEKKTKVLYEIHFQKGKHRVELLLTPDGRCIGKKGKKHHKHEEHDEN